MERIIDFETISVNINDETKIQELIEAFVRLNKGKKLTNMEIFKADLGKKIIFLNEMIKTDFFKIINVQNNDRGQVHDIALSMLLIETNNNTGLSKSEKEAFVKTVNNFTDFSKAIKDSTMNKLDYLGKVFDRAEYLSLKSKDKYLKKTHIIQLFILSKYAMRNNISAENFFKWANSFFFEKKRC